MTTRIPACVMLALLLGHGAALSGTRQEPAAWTTLRNAIHAPLPEGEPVKCGVPLMTEAMEAVTGGRADIASLLRSVLDRSPRQTQKTLGHFTVHFDTTGPNAAAMLDVNYQPVPGTSRMYADSVLVVANGVWAAEVDQLGYDAPPSDSTAGGGPEYDIYLEAVGDQYGATYPEAPLDSKPNGGRFITHMVIDPTFSFVADNTEKGLPAMKVTVAHEFHHAIQMGCYGYWTNEVFFYELTSTWMETVVVPQVPDYLTYLRASWGHFRNPGTSFTSSGLIMYSRCLWATYLAKRFGPGIVREMWEEIRSTGPLEANDLVLKRHGSSLKLSFAEWSYWNYFTGRRASPAMSYDLGALYPVITTKWVDMPPTLLERRLDGIIEGLSAEYWELAPSADTACVIVSNVNTGAASGVRYSYTMTLRRAADDGFQPVVGGVSYLATFSDPGMWKTWVASGGLLVDSGVREGQAFPNPFHPDGSNRVYLPVRPGSVEVKVFDAGMQIVASFRQDAFSLLRSFCVSWDGRRGDGSLVASGVYVFVAQAPQGIVRGKIAVLRGGS